MYTMPVRQAMPRKKKKGPSVNFQLRLTGKEAERWLETRDAALKKNGRCSDTDINRRLLSLDPDLDGLVTEAERLYFLGVGSLPGSNSTKPPRR